MQPPVQPAMQVSFTFTTKYLIIKAIYYRILEGTFNMYIHILL
jgi:hypothetical protein